MNHLFSPLGSGEAVKQKLSQKFKEYLSSAQEEMQALYSLQADKNSQRLKAEADKIQEIIDERQSTIEALTQNISSMKAHKQKRTRRLYSAFLHSSQKKLKKLTLGAWLKFHKSTVQKQKMNVYIEGFCKRGSAMRHFKAWKLETLQFHKSNVNAATQKKIQSEVQVASSRANEEADILRLMVKELTEDLRNETIAKNTLKYKFEQSLLRGMSALNMENMNIQQGIISQNRSFTETSRALLFTPDKLGYLTRS